MRHDFRCDTKSAGNRAAKIPSQISCYILQMKLWLQYSKHLIAALLISTGGLACTASQQGVSRSPATSTVVLAESQHHDKSGVVSSGIHFLDVTDTAGLSFVGAGHGASWGDFNGDTWPDLWTGNHNQAPGLYLNQTDGTFKNIAAHVGLEARLGDTHGAAWADYDNDGDQDLFQQTGAGRGLGEGASHFLVNVDGKFENRAVSLGLDDRLGRGRTPLWLDWNNDGQLDLLLLNTRRPDGRAPSILYEQNEGGFSPAIEFAETSRFAQLAGLSDAGAMDLVIHGFPYPAKVLNNEAASRKDQSTKLMTDRIESVYDVAIADFNNDLHQDLYLARSLPVQKDIYQPTDKKIKARLAGKRRKITGFTFSATGDLNFQLFAFSQVSLNVHIGAQGRSPSDTSLFTVSPHDPSVVGTMVNAQNNERGLYIGYDPALKKWHVLAVSPDKYQVNVAVDGATVLADLETVGFIAQQPSITDQLLIYDQGKYIERNSVAMNTPKLCSASVVAGDFDNDMDIDIYQVCARRTANLPNVLYENLGDGSFVTVSDAGGASGSLLGIGDSVSTVDYDQDGFLDLFVTNSHRLGAFYFGPNQLFKNRGNENHWLEIDLEGVASNRDGIGARVFATTGAVTQLREQVGGMHDLAQNHQRIHFGLGKNTQVDLLVIRWPSGIEQKLENIASNQILKVIEER